MKQISRSNLEKVAEALPKVFDAPGNSALFQRLVSLEAEVTAACGDIAPGNLTRITRMFLELYNRVPSISPLLTPGVGRGVNMEWINQRNTDVVLSLVERGSNESELSSIARGFEEALKRVLEGHAPYFQPGPVKSLDKIIDEMRLLGLDIPNKKTLEEASDPLRHFRDIIRGRIQVENLFQAEEALKILLEGDFSCPLVSCFNTYQRLFPSLRDRDLKRPYLACNLAFAATRDMAYEVQVMTTRAALVGKITHATIRQDNGLPTETQEYIETLAWGSHFLDYQDYLNR